MLRRIAVPLLLALGAAALFYAYLRVSRTWPENSDEANILLQASDLQHGNLLLHGWMLSDASFYTTELPQYAFLVIALGVRPETAHVAAAMTYLLVVLLAVAVAAGGPAAGRAGRAAVTAGVMVAPQLGVGVFVLLLSVGHIGTAVPMLITWLVIDRAARRPRTAAAVALLLAWALVADRLVLLVGVVPLAAVCLLRYARARSAARYELMLAVAAIAAYGLAAGAERLISWAGGFVLQTLPYRIAPPGQWPGQALVAAKGWLALFGAAPGGSWPWLLAVPHLAGAGLVLTAMVMTGRRLGSHAGLIDQVLLLAIVLNLAAYLPSTLASASDLNAREFALALPYGAVLAGRRLGAPVQRAITGNTGTGHTGTGNPGTGRAGLGRWPAVILPATLACYLAGLAYAATRPAQPPAGTQLARWLYAHRLTHGIGGYWQASAVTVASDFKVMIRAVGGRTLRDNYWESKGWWYNAAAHHASFLVTDDTAGLMNSFAPNPAALAGFGPIARVYHYGPYTIDVWHENLLDGPGFFLAHPTQPSLLGGQPPLISGMPQCQQAGPVRAC